jgi:molybdate transport system substrate-binding protein
MATIKVMSAGAVKAMVDAIGPEFERATGHKLELNFGTAGALRDRLKSGETADVVCLPPAMIDQLANEGVLAPGSRLDLGRTVTGVAVKEGAPAPDISTPEAFKQALLAARSVGYPDPKGGGSSGIYFRAMLERLGLAEAVAKKEVLSERGEGVAQSVADGRAELGATFISEILTVPGTQVVGPLPGELHNVNTYSGALGAASKEREAAATLLQALTDPLTRPRWTAAGLEPAF